MFITFTIFRLTVSKLHLHFLKETHSWAYRVQKYFIIPACCSAVSRLEKWLLHIMNRTLIQFPIGLSFTNVSESQTLREIERVPGDDPGGWQIWPHVCEMVGLEPSEYRKLHMVTCYPDIIGFASNTTVQQVAATISHFNFPSSMRNMIGTSFGKLCSIQCLLIDILSLVVVKANIKVALVLSPSHYTNNQSFKHEEF